MWFNIQIRMPDMNHNKANRVSPCRLVSVSNRGLFEFLYEVNGEVTKYNLLTHSSLSGLWITSTISN